MSDPVYPKKLLAAFVEKVGSQTAAAKVLGCSKQHITYLLSGARRFDRVGIGFANRLHDLAGIPWEAMGGEPDEPCESQDEQVDEYEVECVIRLKISRRR